MQEGTTSRVMAADKPYGKFYDFHSISPEYFGNSVVLTLNIYLIIPEQPQASQYSQLLCCSSNRGCCERQRPSAAK
jgi:hypothetical protein